MADKESQAELDRLKEENSRLKAAQSKTEKRVGGAWRAGIAVLCFILAGILAPLSIAGAWARAQLVDEDAFVQTFAPLAQDPDVQTFIIDQTTTAILAEVDVDGLTADIFDGLATLNLPPKAKAALELMQGPAAEGAKGLISNGVAQTVRSDAFPQIWRTTLVASHKALVSAATLDDNGTVVLSNDGSLGVNLGPIVEAIKQRLTDQGVGLASAIPAIDRVVVITQADGLLLIATIYTIANTVGILLPWVTLALLVIGVFVARRRAAGVMGAGIAVALGAGALAGGIIGGGVFVQAASPAWGVPAATMNAVFNAVMGAMRDTAIALAVLGALVAIGGWLAGRSRPAQRLRSVGSSVATSARSNLQSHGLDTGGFGRWLYRHRRLVGALIVVGGVLLLMALRPLSLGDVFGVIALGLFVWLVVTLLQRVDTEPQAHESSTNKAEAATTKTAKTEAGEAGAPEDEPEAAATSKS